MFYFNPYALPLFVVSIIFIFFGVYVFHRNYQNKLNRAFFIWCISAFVWFFSYALCFSSTSESVSYTLAKLGAAGVFLLPSTYHYFVANFIENKLELRISYGFFAFFGLISILTLLTDKLIVGVYKYNFGYHGKGSFLYLICAVLFIIPIVRIIYAMTQYLKRKDIDLKKRKQSIYVFVSLLVASLSTLDFLPKFGIAYYPKGWFFFLIWVFAISYAVLAHNLLDIHIVIKKGFVYSLAVTFITAFYAILVIVTGNIFQGLVGYQSFLLNLFTVFLIALLFNPLRDAIQHVLDKRYFHGTLESLDQERQRLQQELFHKEKLAYVGQLASSVAHEIRNPLTAIKTYIDYLPQKYAEADFKEKFNRLIPKEIERIDRVVSQLLNLAKPRQVDLKPVQIIDLIESTLLLLEDNFALKKITIRKEYQTNAAIIPGDEEQLRQVFLNIFLNAIQAMEEGGELSISVKPYFLPPEPSLKITISDTGCGISEENLKKLFTPFLTTKEDGIGLGLSITQEIIKLHGGRIVVESEVGKGTRFTIELPRK